MKRLLTSLVLMLVCRAMLSAQNPDCGSDVLRQKNPDYEKRRSDFEHVFQQKSADVTDDGSTLATPIVVHLIGDSPGIGTNVSDAQIQSAITNLNINYSFANSQVCGTKSDPYGQKKDGIVRIDTRSLRKYNTEGVGRSITDGPDDLALKALSHWSVAKYYNLHTFSNIEDNRRPNGTGAECGNQGFEEGHFLDTETLIGSVSNTDGVTITGPSRDPSKFALVSPGFDPNFGTPLTAPIPGNKFSLQIGDKNGGSDVFFVRKQFRITDDNSLFTSDIFIGLQDPQHLPHEQPAVSIRFETLDGQLIDPCASFDITAGPQAAQKGFLTSGSWLYRPWFPLTKDLSAYIGQDIVVVATVKECTRGGHSAFMIIDFKDCNSISDIELECNDPSKCTQKEVFCEGASSVTLKGPEGFKSQRWINEGSNEKNLTIKKPVDGTKYKLEMTSESGCITERVFILEALPNPKPDLGPDTTLCGSKKFYQPLAPGETGIWRLNSVQVGTGANFTLNESGELVFQIIRESGCTESDSVKIVQSRAIDLTGKDIEGCDDKSYTIDVSHPSDDSKVEYIWKPDGYIGSTRTFTGPMDNIFIVNRIDKSTEPNCFTTAPVSVKINALPQLSLIDTIRKCRYDFPFEVDAAAGETTGDSFFWNDGSTDSKILITNPGSYMVTRRTPGGCEKRDTVIVLESPIPVFDLAERFEGCSETGINLDSSSFGLPPGTIITSSDGKQGPKFFFNKPGEYDIIITAEKDRCYFSDTARFVIAPTPVSGFGADIYTTTCNPITVSAWHESLSPLAEIEYNGDTIFSKPGVFQLIAKITDWYHGIKCTTFDTLKVEVDQDPYLLVKDTASCDPYKLDLRSQKTLGAVYRMSVNNSPFISADTMAFITPGSYKIDIEATNKFISTCTPSFYSQKVTIYPSSVLTLSPKKFDGCSDSLVVSAITNRAGTQVSWEIDGPNGRIVFDSTDQVTLIGPGNFRYKAKATTPNGCVTEAEDTATLNALPFLSVPPKQIFCTPHSGPIILESEDLGHFSAYVTYVWYKISSNGARTKVGDQSRLQVTEAGVYEIEIFDSNLGCGRSAITEVVFSPKPEFKVEGHNIMTHLPYKDVRLSDFSNLQNFRIDWIPPVNGFLTISADSLSAKLFTSGQWGVRVTNRESGCSLTEKFDVTISELTIYAGRDTVICAPDLESLIITIRDVHSNPSQSARWLDYSGKELSNEAEYQPKKEGKYIGEVTNRFGVSLRDTLQIQVAYPPDLNLNIEGTVCDTVRQVSILNKNPKKKPITWYFEGKVIARNDSTISATKTGTYAVQMEERCSEVKYFNIKLADEIPSSTGLNEEYHLLETDTLILSPRLPLDYSFTARGLNNKKIFRSDSILDIRYKDIGSSETFIVEYVKEGCTPVVVDTVRVNFYPVPKIKIDMPEEVCQNQRFIISNTGSQGEIYLNGKIVNKNRVDTVFTNPGVHKLEFVSWVGERHFADSLRKFLRVVPLPALPNNNARVFVVCNTEEGIFIDPISDLHKNAKYVFSNALTSEILSESDRLFVPYKNQTDTMFVSLKIYESEKCEREIIYKLYFEQPPKINFLKKTDTTCVNESLICIVYGSGKITKPGGITDNKFLFSASAPGVYSVIAKSENTCGQTAFDTLHVAVFPKDKIKLEKDSIFVCANEKTKVSVVGSGNYYWPSVQKYGSKIEIQPQFSQWVKVIKSGICEPVQDSIYISVQAPPDIVHPVPVTLCQGESVEIGREFSGGQTVWLHNQSTDPLIVVKKPGIYYQRITFGGCSEVLTYTVSEIKPTVFWNEDKNPRFCPLKENHNRISVDIDVKTKQKFVWQRDGVIVSNSFELEQGQQKIELIFFQAGNYQLVGSLCEEKSPIVKVVTCCEPFIKFPNSFSPNDDGINDFYFPKTGGIYEIEIRIIDRIGHNHFYKKLNHKDTWDGNFKESDGWDGLGAPEGNYTIIYSWDAIDCETGRKFSDSGRKHLRLIRDR